MSQYSYRIEAPLITDSVLSWPRGRIHKVLAIGHGDIANRQASVYKHWLDNGVKLHFADISEVALGDCLPGAEAYLLPREDGKLRKAGVFDLVLVNNLPELHLITALEYSKFARRMIIQKPQDLNFPLIKTVSKALGYEQFRAKTVIHDHYRNKGAFQALLHALPALHERNGRFTRLIAFLTESRSVREEEHRLASLECGMIQDLAVHMLDLAVECALSIETWRASPGREAKYRRKAATFKVRNCVRLREVNTPLDDDIETFSAIDLEVEEELEYPHNAEKPHSLKHTYDVLIVVGKGLALEPDLHEDLKAVFVEFEREGQSVVADLARQEVAGIPSNGVNRQHGGLTRPLFLLSDEPPGHATAGIGGLDARQWQPFTVAQHVSAIADLARRRAGTKFPPAYPYLRALSDLLRELASEEKIRPTWSTLPSLSELRGESERPAEFYD